MLEQLPMLALDITLAGDASSSTTYSLVSVSDGSSVRTESSAPSGSPRNFVVKHSTRKQGKIDVRQSLVQLQRTAVDAVSSEAATGSVHVVITNPQRVITSAMIKDMLTQLRNFLGVSANVDKILAGEP